MILFCAEFKLFLTIYYYCCAMPRCVSYILCKKRKVGNPSQPISLVGCWICLWYKTAIRTGCKWYAVWLRKNVWEWQYVSWCCLLWRLSLSNSIMIVRNMDMQVDERTARMRIKSSLNLKKPYIPFWEGKRCGWYQNICSLRCLALYGVMTIVLNFHKNPKHWTC